MIQNLKKAKQLPEISFLGKSTLSPTLNVPRSGKLLCLPYSCTKRICSFKEVDEEQQQRKKEEFVSKGNDTKILSVILRISRNFPGLKMIIL